MNTATSSVVNLFGPASGQPAGDAAPSVSVVIPVVADNEALVRLLERLRGLDVPPDEIVIVDGGASAASRSLARRFRCTYVATRAGRGHQLHAGALRASGDVFWFLHADSVPPADGVTLIRARHCAGAKGGYFGFRFTGSLHWYKQVLARLINWRARIGTPYGDQGLFVARSAYDAVGGFADLPLFEEVRLVQRLRRAGTFTQVAATIGVSPRRWERDGWLWRTVGNRLLALAFMLGVSPRRLARRYQPLGPTEAGTDDESC